MGLGVFRRAGAVVATALWLPLLGAAAAAVECPVGTVCTAASAAATGAAPAATTAATTATGERRRRPGDAGTTAAVAPWDTALARASRGGAEMDEKKRREIAELCTLMTAAAEAHAVPHDFFIRLIWKESRFNAGAVSPVGAQGIAQFMPGTARLRGLADPFDRAQALHASASFLADMEADFGSWGLAAIGYNGGPNRVPPLVAGTGGLAYETIDYVYTITGRSAEFWAAKARREREAVDGADDAAAAGGGDGADPAPDAAAVAGEGAAPAAGATGDETAAAGAGAGVGVVLAAVAPDPVPAAHDAADAPADPAAAAEADLGLEPLEGDATSVPGATALRLPLPRPDHEPAAVDCPTLVVALGRAVDTTPPGGGGGYSPYGAQVAGHPKRAVAMQMYARIKGQLPRDIAAKAPTVIVRRFAARGRLPIHAVQFGAGSLGEAQSMCERIAASRAPCVAVKNG